MFIRLRAREELREVRLRPGAGFSRKIEHRNFYTKNICFVKVSYKVLVFHPTIDFYVLRCSIDIEIYVTNKHLQCGVYLDFEQAVAKRVKKVNPKGRWFGRIV